MGGLCAGSLLLPRLKLAAQHPLRVYGKLELGIAACGIVVLFCMPLVDSVYTSAVGQGMPAMLLRAIVCALCLVPPTFLMGASLPAASRWIQTSPEGVSWLGLLYGANTVGAVAGCLIAGFYLLRVFDMATATFAAAALNVVVALGSFAIAKKAPNYSVPPADIAAPPAVGSDAWPIYLTIGLSGATALGGEVIWTRVFGLMLGATVYTFSIILAVFLVGLGIGSTVGSIMARTARNPRALLGWSQFLLAAAIAWTAWQISDSLPYWPVNALLSTSPWYTFQIDMVRCAWGLLPATLFWGASFPLALAAAARDKGDPGQLVGRIYAANTAGAILGALTFSLFLVPIAGTASCEKILIFAAAASGLLVFLRPLRVPALAPAMAATVAAVILALNVQPVPGMLIAYGRRIMTSLGKSRILETGEGINSSIAISEWDDGAVQFHVSGKVEASTESYDMRLQRMLGHMPALMHPNPKSVLIVGFGAGVTAGSFVVHPEVQRIVICEMEPIIPPTATKYFGRQNYNVIHDPRTQVIYDDARHFVLTTPEKFDIITSDPIHPWVKGSATLYSKEYFELVKRHLNPGGVITQWVPLYESDPETVKSEIKTFFDVFPNGTIWGNDISGGGYDIVLLGQVEPAKISVDAMQARLDRPEGARVAESLREVGFGSAVQLLATYAGQEPDLRPWLEGADINRDGSLRLQYVAGWSLNQSKEGAIYSQMLNYRRFPAELFVASPERMQALQSVLQLR
jgi:spermidine synthase